MKVVCHRCGKAGHIKPNCQVKMQESEANVVHESKNSPNSSDPIWEYFFTTEVLDQPTNVISAVYQDDVSTDDQNSNSTTYASEFDSLQILPLDSLFFSDANSAAPGDPSVYSTPLNLGFEEIDDFELTFDDLDDLYLPSEAGHFLILENLDQTTNSLDLQADREASGGTAVRVCSFACSPGSGSSTVSCKQSPNEGEFLNYQSSELRIADNECFFDPFWWMGLKESEDCKFSFHRA